MRAIKYISASMLAVFLTAVIAIMPATAIAQSAQNDCTLPDFQINSDSQVYALTGESFSYYVVTANDTSYQLSSNLPAGLSFTGDQVVGTPQAAGEYVLDFTASNDCGTTVQTVNLTVVAADSAVAQGSADQAANVGLNEIPDTGLTADSTLTVSFYLLALLLGAAWFTRRFFAPAMAASSSAGWGGGGDDVEKDTPADSFATVMRGSFIPKERTIPKTVRRSTASPKQSQQKTESNQSTGRFSDGIRRP